MTARSIPFHVRDGDGHLLEGAGLSWTLDGRAFGSIVDSDGHGTLTFDGPGVLEVTATYAGQTPIRRKLAVDAQDCPIVFAGVHRDTGLTRHVPALIGVFFVLLAVALAFHYTEPNSLQFRVILALLSLGGGAFATEIPGLLQVNVKLGPKLTIAAAGAMGIFVLLYLVVPPR